MIEELKAQLQDILNELENVGGTGHVKAASKRVRVKLSDLKKNITPIKKHLIDVDNSK